MSTTKTETRLRDVLTPVSRAEPVLADRQYRMVGVRLDGKGPFLRETLPGTQIQANQLYRLEKGDFVYSRLFASRGAFGIIEDDLANCYVSGEFPVFRPIEDAIDIYYLNLWFQLPSTLARVLDNCMGSTPLTRNRFKEQYFLNLEIPLPPLAEQRRIVARLAALAAKITEAQQLRATASAHVPDLVASIERTIWPDHVLDQAVPLEAVTHFLARGRQSTQGQSDHYLIKTQHVQMGQYVPTQIPLAPEVAAKVQPEAIVQDGDILIACSAAGCLGRVARFQGDGRTASTDTHIAIARPDPNAVDPDYLYAYLLSAQGQYQLRSRERGDWQREKVGFRLTELNLKDLRSVPVPIPSLKRQREIVATLQQLRERVAALNSSAAASAAHLDALMPSLLHRAFAGEL
jgi:type I restriction enzyme S subunit